MTGFLGSVGANAIANERIRKENAAGAARIEALLERQAALLEQQNHLLGGVLTAVDYLARAEQQRSGR